MLITAQTPKSGIEGILCEIKFPMEIVCYLRESELENVLIVREMLQILVNLVYVKKILLCAFDGRQKFLHD